MGRLIASLAILGCAVLVGPASSTDISAVAVENWPQWRGPEGAGIGRGTYPDTWSATSRIAWKTPLAGRGHSSPVVWGNRIFLTTSIEGAEVPGRKAPDHLDFNLKPGYFHEDSVGVDYAYTLKVIAVDAANGKIVWERPVHDGPVFDNRHRKNTYASSTVVTYCAADSECSNDGPIDTEMFDAGLYVRFRYSA